jgi:hypothetical protein
VWTLETSEQNEGRSDVVVVGWNKDRVSSELKRD